jgi:hypothetical protein
MKMKIKNRYPKESIQANDLEQAANNICEKALKDAKSRLHPLLQQVELDRLDQRDEFTYAFKSALEQRIARKLVAWQPAVQAVFRFDESWRDSHKSWDSSIHLLVKVPRLSNSMKAFGKKLDKSLLKCLKHFGWSRFQKHKSILEIQQVTPNEIRHGVSYGAMFSAVYSAPVKVWPQSKHHEEIPIR